MKISCVLFWVIAFVPCIFVSFFFNQKKLHLEILVSFLSFFVLHFLHSIYCKSLWDPTFLVSWGDKCFSLCKPGFTDLQFSVQPNLFGTTGMCHSVPPTLQSEKQFATCSTFLLIQLHSMNLVLHKHHNFILCFVLNLKDQTYLADSRKNLLGNCCQRGRERSHQSL